MYTIRTASEEPDVRACKRVWAAVLLQAVEDLFDPKRSGGQFTKEQIRLSAENYLFSSDSDYAFETVGIDGDSARAALVLRLQEKR